MVDCLPLVTNMDCTKILYELSNLQYDGAEMIQTLARIHYDTRPATNYPTLNTAAADDLRLAAIRRHADTSLWLRWTDSTDSSYLPVEITHQLNNGKIQRWYGSYSVHGGRLLVEKSTHYYEDYARTDEAEPTNASSGVKQRTGGSGDLTFNLSLSDREKSARDCLVLPYTIDSQQKEGILKGSRIIYENDINDDYDSDDPDDDLDL